MRKLLAKYKNGNYTVKLYDDGTKIKYNDLDTFIPEFSESIDMTITTKCNGGCKYCYLNCNEKGTHANLNHSILDQLRSGTELAINANDLTHPDLENFLIRMKDKGVICNITINQIHLLDNVEKLIHWQNNQLIWGIGISLVNSADTRLIDAINSLKNTVIHVIDGCLTKQDLDNLSGYNLKLLILGFKHKGRGIEYYNKNKNNVDSNIKFLKNHLYDYRDLFNGFGFDTLSTENLEIRKLVGEEKWATNHMGEEGEFTFFIDLVNEKYSISSMDTHMYDLLDSIDDMFKDVRHRCNF